MDTDLPTAIHALVQLMIEEVAILAEPGGHRRLGEIAARKAGMVGAIEAETVRRAREDPDWAERLAEAERERLLNALAALRRAGKANGAALKRQIDLSVDLMTAVAAEARGPGATSATYGANGAVRAAGGGAFSVNSRV